MRLKSRIGWVAGVMMSLAAVQGFAAPPGPRVFGTVSRVAGNGRSFDLVDRSGNAMTISLTETTQYRFRSGPGGTAAEVLTPGEPVLVSFGMDGTAIEVENRSQGHEKALALRPMLGLNDAEWTVLAPLLSRYIDAERAWSGQDGDVKRLENELRYLVRMHASENDLAEVMNQLHQARDRARADLQRAREQLVPLLTLRQEAYLVQEGLLD